MGRIQRRVPALPRASMRMKPVTHIIAIAFFALVLAGSLMVGLQVAARDLAQIGAALGGTYRARSGRPIWVRIRREGRPTAARRTPAPLIVAA